MQVQKAYKIRFSKFSVDLLTWNRIRIQTKSKSHIIINLLMQIFHLNLFFAGQDFSIPYMADDLDPSSWVLKELAAGHFLQVIRDFFNLLHDDSDI